MATMIENAQRYDWDTWLMGIFRSVIGGGSNGVIAGFASMGLDPVKFNLTSGFGKLGEMFAMTFVLSAAIAMFTFLKTHDGPDPEKTSAA